jgi:hypothetical protein
MPTLERVYTSDGTIVREVDTDGNVVEAYVELPDGAGTVTYEEFVSMHVRNPVVVRNSATRNVGMLHGLVAGAFAAGVVELVVHLVGH